MTDQEIFNRVWKHLLDQGKPSVDERGSCQYLSHEGLRCAAGIFIKNYSTEMENCRVSTLLYKFPDDVESFEEGQKPLLDHLQSLHDRAAKLIKKDMSWVDALHIEVKDLGLQHYLENYDA